MAEHGPPRPVAEADGLSGWLLDAGRRRRRQDGEELRQLGHVLGLHPAVLARGPDMGVAGQAAVSGHAAQIGLGKRPLGGAVFGDVPDVLHRRGGGGVTAAG